MIVLKENWNTLRKKLVILFEESFHRSLDVEYLDWRYVNNVANRFHFSIEQDGDQLISSYSASPVRLIYCNELYETAMSMTTMTHPQARGKGYFPSLATELYKDLVKQGIGFIWGFPNTKSHLTFIKKLNWEDIYEIPTFELNLNTSNKLDYPLNTLVQRDDNFKLNYFASTNDELIRIEKSRKYLVWRYMNNPTNKYQNFTINNNGDVSSYVITKKYGESVDIVDIQVSSESEAKTLLAHLIGYFSENDCLRFQCWAPPHHFIHGVLERLKFEHAAPVTYFCARELMHSFLPCSWRSFQHWYVQMGDSDVY